MALPPLIAGVPDRDLQPNDDCGCCDGIVVETPTALENRQGLSAINYRPGAWAQFQASQLARLSAASNPALRRLKSRESDDFSIALIDAWSCVLDVLSFYQERNANEAFLPTALERRSLIELGRLIGYRLDPGVAASTDLVFLMDAPPVVAAANIRGQIPSPTLAVAAVSIPQGSRVQSVPGPGDTPQTFETIEPLSARVEWNAIRARQTEVRPPANGDTGVWLEGVATNLKVGDAIVIVGNERLKDDPGAERWDFRKLTAVATDPELYRTWVEFTHALGSVDPLALTAQAGHRIFALRARASLFGWNAPHPILLSDGARTRYGFTDNSDWAFEIDDSELILDGIQDGWGPGSLVVLTTPGYTELYVVEESGDDGVAKYAMSARTTRVSLDSNEHLTFFESAYRRVSAYGKSEELAFAETPIIDPVMGESIELSGLVDGLEEGRGVVVRGRRAQAIVAVEDLDLVEAGDERPLELDERVTLLAEPQPVSGSDDYNWRLRAPGGFEGSLTAPLSSLAYVEAETSAEITAEPATVAAITLTDETHAELKLDEPLAAAYDRPTVRIHGNIAAATHGETTQEILGDADAGKRFQAFQLKQTPVTYVSAATETGSASSLEVRVNDVLWAEVPTLYGRTGRERVYETRAGDDGATVVQFGDGTTGARPPSGRNNIVATYRKGIGKAGSVAAGTLTTALDRPLGMKEVFNPIAAAGGANAELDVDARENAPVTTLTLGRLVSLRNYEDFARGFAGVSKAKADWAWDGEARRILVTVAGVDGAAVDPATGDLFDNLVKALRTLGDPLVRIAVATYRPAYFKLALKVLVHADYLSDLVLAKVEAALRDAYSFDSRGFAPLVSGSEIIATVHGVAGVEAVDLDLFHRTTAPNAAPILHQRLVAQPASLVGGELLAAEILTLDPGPLTLTVMS
ncbi:hypothetical protein QFZ27_001901 [Inquilinus ginsengisoli]|uniref:putative baseplate assembly protein n=1 Tax=Inquilinus ginsengisoli TaxID=363840 RepID=UPI003D19ED21